MALVVWLLAPSLFQSCSLPWQGRIWQGRTFPEGLLAKSLSIMDPELAHSQCSIMLPAYASHLT